MKASCVKLFSVLLLGSQILLGPVYALDIVDPPIQDRDYTQLNLALEEYRVLDLYPDHTFQGKRAFTRYELADALSRAQNYLSMKYQLQLTQDPRVKSILRTYLKPFGDIPQRHWALNAIQQSMTYGLLTGDQQLKFHGSLKVSRYQLAQALFQIFDWLQIHPIITRQTQKIQDVSENHWASGAVHEVLTAQIMQTDPSGHFHGDRFATRQELANAMVRVLQQVELVALKEGLHPKEVIPLPAVLIHKRPDGRNPISYLEGD